MNVDAGALAQPLQASFQTFHLELHRVDVDIGDQHAGRVAVLMEFSIVDLQAHVTQQLPMSGISFNWLPIPIVFGSFEKEASRIMALIRRPLTTM